MIELQVSVNEAAAQICRHIPALLTRRDELFPLARQVVRDSGYQYSKGSLSVMVALPMIRWLLNIRSLTVDAVRNRKENVRGRKRIQFG